MEGDISAHDDVARSCCSRFVGAREEPGRAHRHRVARGGRGGRGGVVPARSGKRAGRSATAQTAPPYPPLTAEQRAQFEAWYNVQPVVEVPIDKGAAKVLIVKFNDFQCPPCQQTYMEYKGILSKYTPAGA